MGYQKLLQYIVSVIVIALFLVGCGASTASPTRSGPPTYSEVLRTYPRGTELCKTVASIEGVGAGEENWLLKGDVEFRDNQMLVKCYGTKITVNVSVTIGNKSYAPGTKLTVDKDLNWIEVSSWE